MASSLTSGSRPPSGIVRIGLLSNPNSRNNRRGNYAAIARAAGKWRSLLTASADEPAGITAALAEFARQGVNTLLINGGDGTVQAALTTLLTGAVFAKPPLVGLLAGGRTNASAIDAGTAGNPVRQLDRFQAWAAGKRPGQVQTRNVLRLHGGNGAVHFGMFAAGAGLATAISASREYVQRATIPALRGTLGTVAWSCGFGFRTLLLGEALPSAPAEIRLDGESVFAGDAGLLLASTLHRFPLGLKPFWAADRGPVRLTVIAPDCRRRLRAMTAMVWRRGDVDPRPQDGYHSWSGKRLQIRATTPMLLDGEWIPPNPRAEIDLDADNRISLLTT